MCEVQDLRVFVVALEQLYFGLLDDGVAGRGEWELAHGLFSLFVASINQVGVGPLFRFFWVNFVRKWIRLRLFFRLFLDHKVEIIE